MSILASGGVTDAGDDDADATDDGGCETASECEWRLGGSDDEELADIGGCG